ncbi:hypothetical protein ACFVWN_08635 [Nocardiopsis flavescens]|uniref:hypothetical protein n=1 Tax=Nocardiopsis flavescens TaxID=758803 RepID=UPI0036589F03
MKKTQALGLAVTLLAIPTLTASSANAITYTIAGKLETLGTSESNEARSSGLSAAVHEVTRDESGSFLFVTWSLENSSTDRKVLTWLSGSTYIYSGSSFSGVTITSPETEEKYHPIMDSQGMCLCSGNTSNKIQTGLDPEDQVTYWSTYSVSSEAESITVEIPGFEPIEDVPIS